MTSKQKIFCDYYIACSGNGSLAAIKAGYSRKSSRQTAYKLLKIPEIRAYIKSRESEISNSTIADIKEIQAFWTKIMRDEDEVSKNRIKASELLAKSKGAFRDDW